MENGGATVSHRLTAAEANERGGSLDKISPDALAKLNWFARAIHDLRQKTTGILPRRRPLSNQQHGGDSRHLAQSNGSALPGRNWASFAGGEGVSAPANVQRSIELQQRTRPNQNLPPTPSAEASQAEGLQTQDDHVGAQAAGSLQQMTFERLSEHCYRYRLGVTDAELKEEYKRVRSRINDTLFNNKPPKDVLSCTNRLILLGRRPDLESMQPTIAFYCIHQAAAHYKKVAEGMTFIDREKFAVEILDEQAIWASLGEQLDSMLEFNMDINAGAEIGIRVLVTRFQNSSGKTNMNPPLGILGSIRPPSPAKGVARYFTIGGLLLINNELYGLTTAHQFYAASQSSEEFITLSNMGLATKIEKNGSREKNVLWDTGKLAAHQWGPDNSTLPGTFHSPTDWALVKFRPDNIRNLDDALVQAFSMKVDGFAAILSSSPPTKVLVCSGRSNPQEAMIDTNMVSIRLGDSVFDAFALQLEHPLVDGDSGSWVLSSGKLCGYIICRLDKSLEAYMSPIFPVIHSLKNHFQYVDGVAPKDCSITTPSRSEIQRLLQVEMREKGKQPTKEVQRAEPAVADPHPAGVVKQQTTIVHEDPRGIPEPDRISIVSIPSLPSIRARTLFWAENVSASQHPWRFQLPLDVSEEMKSALNESPLFNLNTDSESPSSAASLSLAADRELTTLHVPWRPELIYKIRGDRYHPLSEQIAQLKRRIVLTEQPELHLTVSNKTIVIKPLPMFLFGASFYDDHLSQGLTRYGSACGILLSYILLVMHKTDLRIAQEHFLLPGWIEWSHWTAIAEQFLRSTRYVLIPRRYLWGELELTLSSRFVPRFMSFETGDKLGVARIPAQTKNWVTVGAVLESLVKRRKGPESSSGLANVGYRGEFGEFDEGKGTTRARDAGIVFVSGIIDVFKLAWFSYFH